MVHIHTVCVCADIPIQDVEPRSIVANPQLLEKAIDYFTENVPDISDKPDIPDEAMCIWTKHKRKSRLKPHSVMAGACGTYLNSSYDFAIANNMWPVVFRGPGGVQMDLVVECMVATWIKYVSMMVCIRACMIHIHAVCIRAFMVHIHTVCIRAFMVHIHTVCTRARTTHIHGL